ncbi:hypothetical protein J3458_001379 [Metarhizium acridum]|uniref:uncharacterized protein n=1 Tax=Metarhizium acridum TaxID=92637 RepID=UPI001C6C8003|nr:hypothetical protein J3458_001379 [Metarhizium acridum]
MLWYNDETVFDHQGPDGAPPCRFHMTSPFNSVASQGTSNDSEDGLISPALCGFEYSRPADLDETSERPSENPWFDLYRHAKTQFNVPREGRNGFRKLYSVCSLGAVLYELAVLKPINIVLGLDRKQRPKPAAVQGVQTQLLSHKGISMLKSAAGDVFAGIVKSCLPAEAVDNQTLQLEFWESEVMVFDGMMVYSLLLFRKCQGIVI